MGDAMATKTRAEMIARILENLGVVAAGQTASSEDSTLAGEALDGVFERRKKLGHVIFEISAVPEWAQSLLVDIVSENLIGQYKIGPERAPEIRASARMAEMEFAQQVQRVKAAGPVETYYF